MRFNFVSPAGDRSHKLKPAQDRRYFHGGLLMELEKDLNWSRGPTTADHVHPDSSRTTVEVSCWLRSGRVSKAVFGGRHCRKPLRDANKHCGPLFRDQTIEWSNGSSWVTVDRPWRKPCCALSNKGQRNILKCLNKYLSNTLDTTSSFSPFLWTGTTRPSFHLVSSLPSVRDKLKRAQREGVTSFAHSLARLWEER